MKGLSHSVEGDLLLKQVELTTRQCKFQKGRQMYNREGKCFMANFKFTVMIEGQKDSEAGEIGKKGEDTP